MQSTGKKGKDDPKNVRGGGGVFGGGGFEKTGTSTFWSVRKGKSGEKGPNG